MRREGRRTIDRRHVTDDGNWSNWNLKILQLEKLQIGGGFLAPSKGSGEWEGGLLDRARIDNNCAMSDFCCDQTVICTKARGAGEEGDLMQSKD